MKRLFTDGWEFSKQPLHTTLEEMQAEQDAFVPIGLPHDWLIYDADNLYEDGTGWYRRKLTWKKKEGEVVFLRFDGIYMDSRIFVNGEFAFEWKYGYSAFEVDLTSYLKDGENEIWVSVDFQAPNIRWYIFSCRAVRERFQDLECRIGSRSDIPGGTERSTGRGTGILCAAFPFRKQKCFKNCI